MSKIGIFDSGVGGLTVLKEMVDKFPNNYYIYIGDNKNCPYGDKSKEELYQYAKRIIDYLVNRKVETVLVACNTISSTVLDTLQEEYKNIKIIGVIDATIKEFVKSNCKEVLIMATNTTISTGIYENKIKAVDSSIKVINLKSPKLVPAIENNDNVEQIVKEYLTPYKNVEAVILGCTHYPLVLDYIKKYTSAKIISSSSAIVKTININIDDTRGIEIYTTGDLILFNTMCSHIIKKEAKYLNI